MNINYEKVRKLHSFHGVVLRGNETFDELLEIEKDRKKRIEYLMNRIDNLNHTDIKLDILFVDDNSSDLTQSYILSLSKKHAFIKYIFRKNKVGIGSAHKDGIKYCYKKKYDLIITMDADGTHDPKYLKQMISI